MSKSSFKLSMLLSLLLLTVYGPYILYGGFGPSDDLAFVYSGHSGFTSLLSYFLTRESIASRPLTAFFWSIIFPLFGDTPRFYIILQLSIWISSIALLSKIVKLIFGRVSALLFIVFGAMPIFSSAVIFSSYLVSYTISIFFWALSLIFIYNYAVGGGRSHYWMSHLFLTMGLLSMEIIMPLLLFNALLPWIVEKYAKLKERGNDIKIGFKYIYPIIGIMVLFYIFKVFITGIYISSSENSDIYGLSLSTKSFFQSIYYFITLFFEIPIMLIETIPFLLNPRIIVVSIIISTFLCYLGLFKSKDWNKKNTSKDKKLASDFIKLVIIGIFFCSTIFILSGYPAVTFGHYNKMMLPTHILVSILTSWYFGKMIKRKKIILAVVFSVLWSSSMIVQIDGFIDSWKIRKTVLSDCTEKLNDLDLGKEPYLIACVPYFTQNNYNNEHVFWLSWDFSPGLELFGLDKQISPFPFCWQTLVKKDYYPRHNINTFLSKLPQDANIWLYEYKIKSRNSELRKIVDAEDLDRQLTVLELAKTNYHRIILRQRVRMKLKIVHSWL